MESLEETLIHNEMLPKMSWVRDLVYFEGPLLSHFISVYNEDFLYYWADSDEIYNRWLIFRISSEDLTLYLKKEKTLYQILLSKDKGHVYKVDIDSDLNYHNLSIISPEKIPSDYLPEQNSFYTQEVDIDKQELKSISKKEGTGVLQAYFNETSHIGLGEIDLEVLAPVLSDLNNINNGIRRLFIKRESKRHKENKGKNVKEFEITLRQATKFVYFGNTDRSFGALLKPMSSQTSLQDIISIEDRYIEFFMQFFQFSSSVKKFSDFIVEIDKSVVDSYKKLLKVVTQTKVQFNLNYENFQSSFETNKSINFGEATLILSNIERLEYDNSKELTLKGYFTSLNLKTGSYRFETITENNEPSEESTGYLDADRKEMAFKISWKKLYQIIVLRKEIKKIGSKKVTVTDTLVSFIDIGNRDLPTIEEETS